MADWTDHAFRPLAWCICCACDRLQVVPPPSPSSENVTFPNGHRLGSGYLLLASMTPSISLIFLSSVEMWLRSLTSTTIFSTAIFDADV